MRLLHKNARISSSVGKGVKAFTLIEMLLSTMLGGIVVGVVAFIFANMAGSFAEQPTTGANFDWDVDGDGQLDPIPYSPAYSQLPQAFSLQAEVSDCLQTTLAAGALADRSGLNPVSAIYVLSSDEGVSLPDVPVGDADDIASIPAISGVRAVDLTSSSQFSALFGAGNVAQGYSIYFVSADDTVNLAIHVRAEASGNDTIYRVKTYALGDFCPNLSYAFGVRNLDASVNPSAIYLKLRTNAAWGIDEDIGTQVVFPDPTAVAYQILPGDANAVRTYSRFAVLLPIQP